jgi:light-regulated signal transduction histidine kinase (bacteriophytochrome)
MTGYTSMLQEGHTLSNEHKRITQRIVASGMKMANMLEQLLDFYRSQRNELNRVLIPIHTLIEELTKEVKRNEPQRDISFHLHPAPNAVADPVLIRQVWINLILNAVKYTAKTPQTVIEIGGKQTEEFNIYHIKDNGIGFDMEYYDQLFGVFKRLPGSEQFEGAGVGLANVHRIILRHGGKVWAESKPGEGATFYFSLPAQSK